MTKSEKTICVSNAIKNYFELEGNSTVVYNGVMPIPNKKIIFEKDNYFIFASNLSVKKGIFDVLSAFKAFTQNDVSTELLICGTGGPEITKSIQKYIEVENLSSKVKLLGYRNDVLILLRHAKACFMASHNEAFGRTTAEAMFMGCPVIGKSSGGTLEIIQTEKFGFLYNTINEMSNCMEEVVDIENTDMVNNIIDSAFERAVQLYSQEQLCIKVLEVYETLNNPKLDVEKRIN